MKINKISFSFMLNKKNISMLMKLNSFTFFLIKMPQISFKSLSFFSSFITQPLFVCFCVSFIHSVALDSLWIFNNCICEIIVHIFHIDLLTLFYTHKKGEKKHKKCRIMSNMIIEIPCVLASSFPSLKCICSIIFFLLTRLKSFYKNWNRIANKIVK